MAVPGGMPKAPRRKPPKTANVYIPPAAAPPRPKPVPKPVLTGSRGDTGRGSKPRAPKRANVYIPPAAAPRPAPTTRPGGDIKSDADLGRATTFKHTQKYRGATRNIYLDAPLKQRKDMLARARRKPDAPENKAILSAHHERAVPAGVTGAKRLHKLEQALPKHVEDAIITRPGGERSKAKGLTPPGPLAITSKPTAAERKIQQKAAAEKPAKITPVTKPAKGGLFGSVTGAVGLADKLLSGKLTAGLVNAASKGVGEFASGPSAAELLGKAGIKYPHFKKSKRLEKFSRAFGREFVDVPANFIPSVYVPAKETTRAASQAARGQGAKALKTEYKGAIKPLYEGAKEAVTHPLEHPISAALTLGGVEGFVGRGAGAALRKGAAGKAGRRVARTERANRVIPSTGAEVSRTYDPDVIRKGVQVAAEKVAAKGRTRKGGPAGRRMTAKDINREVDQDVRIGRNVTTLADERAAIRTADAVNPKRHVGPLRIRRKLRNKPVTAAHTAAVQGLTNATKADLERLLTETETKAKGLGGDKLRQNQQRQKELRKALKDWKPGTETHIREVQKGLREQTAVEEAALVDAGVLDASKADADRYSTAAVRHGLHDPETAATHVADAGREAARAGSQRRGFFRRRQGANAALREQTAKTRAAELGPRGKSSAGTVAAERELRGHEKTLQKGKEQEARDLAAARKELEDARHAAELTTKEVSPTPEVLTTAARLKKAQDDLAALTRQATGRERISGRQEGRVQEKVAVHGRAQTAQGRRLSEEADRRQAELAVHNRTLATVEGAPKRGARAYSQKQIDAVRRRRDNAQKRADAADEALTRHHAEGPRKGTEPRGPLAALERRGGEDLQLRQRVLAARAEVENALSEHARAQSRAKGVPPTQADRLRKAIAAHDDARLKFANPDSLAHLRDTVDVAKAKLVYEQSKRGLEPAAAERLWKAIRDAEDATVAHTKAIAEHEAARARHRALQDAPYVDSKGVPHTVEDVRAHPAVSGQPEPSFMPHAYETAHGAVPVNKVKAASPDKQRTGLMVTEGTSPVAGGQITTARIARARMITAANNRIAIIDKWGYRDGVPATEPATVYATKGLAEKAAADAEKITGHPMAAFADQKTSGYVLVPKQTISRLGAHEETILHRDRWTQRAGRAWRTGVLSLSTRWLTGQVAEPAFRLAVAHNFNPVKLARSYRLLSRTADELKAADPEAFARFESTYKRGGLSRGVKVSRDEALQDFLMGDAAGGFEAAVRNFAQKPVAKQLHALAGAHMRFWFHWLNGSIESLVRRGLVGHELIKDPIIRDRKFALNFADAAKDLAEGLKDTPAQNRVARNLDDSFGRYQGRSPREQAFIENYTPFIPWFLSSMRFLYTVLPRDHPVLTGLVASSNVATEQWRRKYGLYFDASTVGGMGVAGTDKNLPLSQQGSIPVGKNNADIVNVSHYLPTGGPQGFGDVGSFLVPQLQDIMAASAGKDWKGYGLTGRDKPVSLQRIAEATLAATATTFAPPVGVAAKLAGVHLPSEPDLPAGQKEPGFGERFGKQFNPLPRKPGLAKGVAQKKQRRSEASKRANAKRRKPKPPGRAPANPFAGQAKSNPFAGGGG